MVDHPDYSHVVTDEWRAIHDDIDLVSYELALRIMRIGRMLEVLTEKVASMHGLTAKGDFDVLSALRRSEHAGLRPNDLAERLMVTTAGMTGRLDRLERAGLVYRRGLERDRRGVEVLITDAGIEVTDAIARHLAAEYGAAIAPVAAESPELGSGLMDLARALGDDPPV